jgi:hypothetical protein
MAERKKNSLLALKTEVTEGTPVLPTAGADFIAIQDDIDIDPSFETLDNAELKASIGKAKSLLGLEVPKMSFSHYLRHSGVEGTAPGFSELVKSAFGAEEVNATQYDTVAASTVSVVKVDTGEGATFSRGEALLVKDPTNGYSIRPVFSVSSDDLTLGFDLANAPGTGVNLGKAVKYSVANQDHPALTATMYRGNGGVLEVLAGIKVTEMSVDVTAGEFINSSFSMEGTKYHFDPINILAADAKFDFLDNATTRVATVAVKLYRDPHELADALASSMNALGSANTFTVVYNDTGASAGKFTITSTGATLSLLWSSGANTANTIGDKIGFVTASDDTGSLTYTSDNAQSWAAALTPSYDVADPLVAKYNEVLIGDSDDIGCIGVQNFAFKLSNTKANIPDLCAESGISGSLFTERTVSVDFVATLTRHDADKFRRFREGSDTRFCFNAGVKSGGNWVAGKCISLFIPTATVTAFKLSDADGVVTIEATLTAYVDANGNGECYLNFV